MSTRILIDTNAYSAYMEGVAEAVEIIEYADRIAMPGIVLGELLSGFVRGNREEQNRRRLQEFLNLPGAELVWPDPGTAEVYALLSLELSRKGRPIPTNDQWIAALVIQHGDALFTYDEHFKGLENLKVGQTADELLD